MSDIVGSLTTEMRITGRIFRETLLGLKRTGWMNVVIVVTMASILSIFGVVMALLVEMNTLIKNVGTELEISAYLKDAADAKMVQQQILTLPHIKRITLVTKQKAWSDMQKEYPLPDVDNPLPDTFHIQMNHESYIPETVDKLRSIPEIEAVQFAKEVLDKIRSLTQGASIVGTFISIFLGALTLFIISNTIHLLIQAKSREIEILRMMGVGNWYIRMPFLLQGGAYGLVGAIVSYVPLSMAVFYMSQFFEYLGFQSDELITSYVTIILILMGMLVGAGGATFAVRKYLNT